MTFEGKRAIVTGGSSGIGLAIARELLRRRASVEITGRRRDVVEQAVEKLKPLGTVSGIAADVTTTDGRQRTLELAHSLGQLDLLVNNAGGVRAGHLEDNREDEVLRMIEVNLTGPILLTRAALPLLKKSKGAIVNVSSSIALVGLPFYAAYAAAKAGIAHFGEALRRELAEDGVRVLTVYPTATDTPMMATSGMSKFGGREAPEDVARAVVDALVQERVSVVRGGPEHLEMINHNRTDPEMVDAALRPKIRAMEEAAQNHSAL